MPLSPSETTEVLKSISHRPKKKLGQNFLIDGNLVKKSIAMSELEADLQIVEIGPGLGTLTQQLLENGQTVHAVEFDYNLYSYLKVRFQDFIRQKKLFLTRADAVRNPIGSLPADTLDYMVVANLPYAISSPWLEALLATERIPERMILMLQKEAAERICSMHNAKKCNALSIFLDGVFAPRQTHQVPRQCFYPAPAVDSILIRMDRREKPFLFSSAARSLIRRIFTQRRKQISSLAKQEKTKHRKELLDWIDQMNLPKNLRPEEIAPSIWRELARSINT